MKFKVLALVTMTFSTFSSFSHSAETVGPIDEIILCELAGDEWVKTLQFKVNNQWFGIYADYFKTGNSYDNNMATSLIYMAYSQESVVKIKASGNWANAFTACDVASGSIIYRTKGDYISLSR
ncbi:hypothetical protein [uncultured Psychromonas sp.]|uniref:hypothetical protein n=1 Tax=uncultured Psychromonas sp. TaxID=173974 RepID=UPI00261FA862|nr:hypothetical protein [uncultured Psychromonas sp.]